MKTAEEIMNKHFKECFEIHKETVSEKYIFYFHRAMNEYAQQESEKAVNEYREKIFKMTKHLSMTGNIDLMSDAAKINALIEKLK